ncbi:phage-type endonuclease [[Clostridium] sordellii]|uniref:Phage-type endonuclease domain protein n=1 Tax=Paraclostridium sordellii TaxID=1505 RepID=A0ABP1XVD4_PARSO|nr:YqaJ viral recombinase family protein [Paeniclostridium sordellii]CEJ74248.1 putative phage-type endonuclease domain protein [[Clostridium] sordellii] [Paeniclostridium sordellii]CEN69790.1 phage-type endonuclease [[Clostridium] sordellii] [Paeniclostridium sordellii]CEN73058.1 phage-type endonuclease [[Clostridium] sordellii] [Paeniclostridium sordellii]CEO25662.1 phage-type endonuclease [[Clostridium] sordellii] [Paeniclostridium sordellii]CEP75349.1 phage-type endonuclease [[Clostridium]
MNEVAILYQDEKFRKYLDAKVIADTKNMTQEEWLKSRQAGIGGSDSSAIAGLNPWKSSIQLYMEKKEENPQEIKSLRMELGNRLEGLVAELFTEETGLKVRNVNGILKNGKYPFALANIDRAIVGEKAFLECKTTNSFALKEWQDGVPPHYEIQCLHYMAITGATHCYIAALIGNSDFIWYKIERDQETIDYLMQIEKEFWEENILKDIVPLPDGSDAYSEYLKEKYKKSNGQEIELHLLKDGPQKLLRYDEIVTDIKALETEKKLIEQEIQIHMEDFEVAKIGDRKITWKTSSRNTIDSKKLKAEMPDIAVQYTKTSTSRTFRIGGNK